MPHKSPYEPISFSEIEVAIARIERILTRMQIELLQQRTQARFWTWNQFVKVLLIV